MTSTDESRDLPRGRRVLGDGRYVLGGLLGRGGMADVYQAHDQALGRDVAVKLLRDPTSSDVDRARFLREARTLARLSHPSLVTILDAGISEEHPYLVLELVVGFSLSTTLAADGALPLHGVADLGAQIASALTHCHAAGIIHRDVKPGNILLAEDGRALLTDFGIARLLDDTTQAATKTGFTIGTAGYLAPEQVYGAELTTAVDLYALGLVLLEASTGHREYTGTPVEAALARLHRSPRIPGTLPEPLAGVLASMTRTDPHLRPPAAEVATLLADVPSVAPAPGTSHADVPTGPIHLGDEAPGTPAALSAPPRRTRPRALVAAASAAAVAAALAVVALNGTLTSADGTTPQRPLVPTTSSSPAGVGRVHKSQAATTANRSSTATVTHRASQAAPTHRSTRTRLTSARASRTTHTAAVRHKSPKPHAPAHAGHHVKKK